MVILAGIVGFILGALVLGIVVFLAAPKLMIVEGTSRLGHEEAVNVIKQAAAGKGWNVSAVHEFHVSAAKAGHNILPATVVEMCQPHYAAQVLQEDRNRIVASLMPCRIAVYTTSDGRVVISRMNTKLMSKLFPGTIAAVMAKATAETEEMVSSVQG